MLLQIDLSPLNKYECGGKQALFKSVSAQAFLRPREAINLSATRADEWSRRGRY